MLNRVGWRSCRGRAARRCKLRRCARSSLPWSCWLRIAPPALLRARRTGVASEQAERARAEHKVVRSCESGEALSVLRRRALAAQGCDNMDSALSRSRLRDVNSRAKGPRAPRRRRALREPLAQIRWQYTECSCRWRAECMKASVQPGTRPKTFGVEHLGFCV